MAEAIWESVEDPLILVEVKASIVLRVVFACQSSSLGHFPERSFLGAPLLVPCLPFRTPALVAAAPGPFSAGIALFLALALAAASSKLVAEAGVLLVLIGSVAVVVGLVAAAVVREKSL